MNSFLQTLRNLGPVRLVVMAVTTFALLGFFIFLITRVTATPMGLLYDQLESQDSGAVVRKLESMKIPYKIDDSGRSIRIPQTEIGRIRMLIAADGIIKGGSIGYEIFDQKEGFGATSFLQNLNHLRALEGELARSVASVQNVESARVHLVLPKRELFSHTTNMATASVFLKVRGGELGQGEIRAIQNLIASAVPQLQPNQVSIIDDKGTLLARPHSAQSGDSTTYDEARTAFEQAQARKIEDLLFQSLGYGKARAQVSAELDVDRVVVNSETFDPDSKVVRSTQVSNEETKTTDANQGVTIANNLPGSQVAGANPNPPTNQSNRSEETINYEINKVVRNQIRESGEVKRLSIAVVVDGDTTTGDDGKPVWRARTPEEMEKIKSLVRSAVTFDSKRGDTLEVANMRFNQEDLTNTPDTAAGLLFGFPRTELLAAAEKVMMSLVGLLALLLIARPLMRRILESESSSAAAISKEDGFSSDRPDLLEQTADSGESGQLPPPMSAYTTDVSGGQSSPMTIESQTDAMFDLSRVEGRVKASSIRKVGEIIDKHPDEVVAILRNWMSQESVAR